MFIRHYRRWAENYTAEYPTLFEALEDAVTDNTFSTNEAITFAGDVILNAHDIHLAWVHVDAPIWEQWKRYCQKIEAELAMEKAPCAK